MIKKMSLIFILMAFFLTACSAPATPSEDTAPVPEKSTSPKTAIPLRITWKTYSGRGETVQNIVGTFNQTQTDYEIQLISGDEDLEAVIKSFEQAQADIYVLPYRFVKELGPTGYLKQLDSSQLENMSSDLMELAMDGDRLYGFPWVSHSTALLYNKDLVETAGIDPESIIDRSSFLNALDRIEATTDASGIGLVGADHHDLSWMVNQFIYGSGGQLESEGKVAILSDASIGGLTYYIRDLGGHAQPTWHEDTGIEVMDLFRNEKVAFEIQGLWGVTDIAKSGAPFEVGILPLSAIQASAEVGPLMLTIRANLPEEKMTAAETFVNYMVSKDAQVAILHGEYSPEHDAYYPFRLPVRSDALDIHFLSLFPDFDVFISSYASPSIDVPSPKWMTVRTSIYTKYIHQMVTGQLSISQGVEKIQTEGAALYEGEK